MSSNGGISGLGISFSPSPPRPSFTNREKTPPRVENRRPSANYRQPLPSIRHSVSYDVGLNRGVWDEHHDGRDSQFMLRHDSGESDHRRVRIATGEPEVFGGGKVQHGVHLPTLSPLSDFDSGTSSDETSFSPASLSSLPSSTDHAAPFEYYDSERGRLAKSMGAVAQSTQPTQPHSYPSPIDLDPSPRLYRRPHPNSEAEQPRQTSRLPPFLHEQPRGQVFDNLTSESLECQNGHQDAYDSEYDHRSTDSIPSSAGGLQRQRQHQQQFDREMAARKIEQGNEYDRLPAHPAASERVHQARRRARSVSLSVAALPDADADPRPRPRPQSTIVMMRSVSQMKGLEPAETGGAFVEQDTLGQTFSEGGRINPKAVNDGMSSGDDPTVSDEEDDSDTPLAKIFSKSKSVEAGLSRQSTLLTAGANPVRRSKELDRLLSSTKKAAGSLPAISGSPALSAASSDATGASSRSTTHAPSQAGSKLAPAAPVVLEQAKSSSKARVELDLVLESSLVVEGGTLKGRIEVRVRKPKDSQSEVWLGKPKVRVIGFEELAAHDARHIFYHHASSISSVDASATPPTDSEVDSEGFRKGVTGQHVVPFSLRLPVGKGAKGGWKEKQGVVRYIVIASMKLKSETGGDRSIAHFYRHVEVFPYLNPAIILAPALKPLTASTSKFLFMGGSGKVTLSASMHRAAWVAGQRCYVDVRVENGSNKKIKTLTLTLLRTTTIFRPRPWLNTGAEDPNLDADACQTQTTRKKIAETTLEMGKKVNKGVTAKGSWLGVDGGETTDFSHFLLVPPESLTVLRGRYLEVTYALKVAVGASLSADVSTEIPLRIVNFVSLDPPPGHSAASSPRTTSSASLPKSWSIDQLRPSKTQLDISRNPAPAMARLASFDSLRLSDLNGGRGPSRAGFHNLSRIASLDSVRTDDISRSASPLQSAPSMARASTAPSVTSSERGREMAGKAVVGRAKERQIVHQISLDCISSAIASATARRQGGGHQHSASALRSEFMSAPSTIDESDDEAEDVPARQQEMYYGGGGERFYDDEDLEFDDREESRVELDDLEDVPDDVYYQRRTRYLGRSQLDLAGDSEDELDAVLAHSPLETYDELEDNSRKSVAAMASYRPNPPLSARSPVTTPQSRPSSPVKAESARAPPKSAMKRQTSTPNFVFATSASPLKVPSPKSAVSHLPSVLVGRASARGPLPAPPSTSKPASDPRSSTASSRARSHSIVKQVSASSPLKRTTGVIAKRPSSRSLAVAPSPTFSHTSLGNGAEDLEPTSAKPSRVLKAARTPPMAAAPFSPVAPPSPRKVLLKSSPSLTSTRSLGDLRSAAASRPSTVILPSVRSKVAALEVRQTALAKLALTGSNSRLSSAGGHPMQRGNSTTESDASFSGVGDLSRANSDASFQAPLFRRVHKEV